MIEAAFDSPSVIDEIVQKLISRFRPRQIYLFGSRMGCVAFNEVWLRQGKPALRAGPAK